jgi:predicted flap endonuclease-1-like 5' DNA nuclease
MNSSSHSASLPSYGCDLKNLPGLSADNQHLLHQHGIDTTAQLFHKTQTPAQRHTLATTLKIHPQYVEKWAALANLARVPGVGCQYCGLLLHAGISSTQILAQASLPRLHRQVLKLHVATLQRQDLCPSLGEVSQWIQQARAIASQDTKTYP